MVTFVGMQEDFTKALKELIELDRAAIEAYETAIEHLENKSYREKLGEFQKDHERHVKEVSDLLMTKGEEIPDQRDWTKELLATGKVMMANLVGDNAILQAMKSNETDTNTAYERMDNHNDKWQESEDIIKQGLRDEKRHKAWLESTLSS
jgi:rubrerythrin